MKLSVLNKNIITNIIIIRLGTLVINNKAPTID